MLVTGAGLRYLARTAFQVGSGPGGSYTVVALQELFVLGEPSQGGLPKQPGPSPLQSPDRLETVGEPPCLRQLGI